MENVELRRLLLVATVTALSVTALIAILALLTAEFGDTELRILATTGGFGLTSLLAMRGTTLLDQRRHESLGRAVLGLSALSFLVELWIIWLDTDSAAAWKSYVCVIASAVASAQIAGMLSSRRATDPPAIAPLVLAAATVGIVAALMACAAAIGEISDGNYYRLFGVVVVLNAFLIALQPVVRRLGRPSPVSEVRAGGFVVVLRGGRRVDHEAGSDLPNAVARALREHGDAVTRVEFHG